MKLLKWFLSLLIGILVERLDAWVTKAKLEQAESKTEALKARMVSLEEAYAEEGKIQDAAVAVVEKYKEVAALTDKLVALKKFNCRKA